MGSKETHMNFTAPVIPRSTYIINNTSFDKYILSNFVCILLSLENMFDLGSLFCNIDLLLYTI